MASSKEDAMRAAGTDIIRAQSGPPLPNFRQEAFAQRIAAGCSATAAYASPYGRPRDASSRVNEYTNRSYECHCRTLFHLACIEPHIQEIRPSVHI